MKIHTYLSALLLLTLSIGTLHAQQTDTNDEKVRLFLDCRGCNESYIQNEVTFINYVRDKEDAQVHLLITRQRTGSGTEFTLQFLGRDNFLGNDNTLTYNSPDSDTRDEERRGLVRHVKIGLLPYAAKTDAIDNLDISYSPPSEESTTPQEDPWNSWIFELDLRSFFNGEETSSNIFVSAGAEAERITENWKTRLAYDYDLNRRRETFTETDSAGNKTEVEEIFTTRGQNFHSFFIKSMGEHWAGGLFANARSSTRNNIDLNASAGPGIEYNIFPYREYTEREITFSYFITPEYRNYADTTIFNKIEETVVRQRLLSRIEFTQPWGEIEGRANFSSFLHDLSKNRLDINMEIDFRIFRGLSLNLSGRYSFINDQLSVPKGNITDAQQLLNLRQRLTSYSFRGSIGIEYTFGSIFNSAVNPRF